MISSLFANGAKKLFPGGLVCASYIQSGEQRQDLHVNERLA